MGRVEDYVVDNVFMNKGRYQTPGNNLHRTRRRYAS